MATALAMGVAGTFTDADRIVGTAPTVETREKFAAATGCSSLASNSEATQDADIVVLSVKPQYLAAAAAEIRGALTESHLVVSVVAGATLGRLNELLGGRASVVRVMPNTPALIGCGASAICGEGDLLLVQQMMQTVGEVIVLPESQMDAVTGLSGSGPAYVYQFIEALSDGGVKVGLSRATATQLAAQTVLGAAQMVIQTGQHPGELKDAVASPGGTTIAGIHELEKGAFRATVINAVVGAAERSAELGQA